MQQATTMARCPFSAATSAPAAADRCPAPREIGAPGAVANDNATSIPRLLRLLDGCLDATTGLLPRRTPLHTLPAPFTDVSRACAELSERYHAPGADVRPWLEETFGRERAWVEATTWLDDHAAESLMTQVSLLCHAYRWQSAPTPEDNYRIDGIDLPPALASLWSALSTRLGIPRVGVFYTMVCNNWRLRGRKGGSSYEPGEVDSDDFELMYSWLQGRAKAELRAFIRAAIGVESRGAASARILHRVYSAIFAHDAPVVTEALVELRSLLAEIAACFNQHIRRQKIRPGSFRALIQPTMIWLLDEGEGPLEGASGPQAVLLQLIDSALGVPRTSSLGPMLMEARRYMLPAHRCLLAGFDGATGILRDFVQGAGDEALTAAYDDCLTMLERWRRSHRARGAMFIRGDETSTGEYASTGLVVGLDSDHVATFQRSMDGHIEATGAQRLG